MAFREPFGDDRRVCKRHTPTHFTKYLLFSITYRPLFGTTPKKSTFMNRVFIFLDDLSAQKKEKHMASPCAFPARPATRRNQNLTSSPPTIRFGARIAS